MKNKSIIFVALLSLGVLVSCKPPAAGDATSTKPSITNSSPVTSVTPVPTSSTPKNGDYNGKGVVTKLNLPNGSVELDHEEIEGVMPAMRMEFNVTDKKMLDALKVGDKVDFVLRYKDYTEVIVNIKKAQ